MSAQGRELVKQRDDFATILVWIVAYHRAHCPRSSPCYEMTCGPFGRHEQGRRWEKRMDEAHRIVSSHIDGDRLHGPYKP